jgi:hypothetical protein
VSVFELMVLLPAGLLALAVVLGKAKTVPAGPARLSKLSAAGFFCAMLALATALAAVLTWEFAERGDLLGLRSYDVYDLRLASEILRYCALAPAVAALAFAVAGRGAIRESQGALRGRMLYRIAIALALGVGAASFAGIA